MYLEFVKFLTGFVCIFSLVELSLGCGNRTRQKRQDGTGFADMAVAGAAMAVDLLQQGGGLRNNFQVKFGNENYFHKSKNLQNEN